MLAPEWFIDIIISVTAIVQLTAMIISAALTGHVLLNKSDPKGSLLWLTLIWLVPFLGAIIYWLFGINRIERRARRVIEEHNKSFDILPTGDGFDSQAEAVSVFRDLGKKVTRYNRTADNDIEIIQGVEAIHRSMIHAIKSAKTTIILSTYIFKRDDLGLAVRQALIEADQRGVDVKVLLDGVGNGFFRSQTYRKLKSGGVDVRRFLHSKWPWRMPYLNLRNHRKILVVDAKLGFTGSMNIGRVKNIETQFKVSGPVIRHLTDAYDFDWRLAGGHILGPKFRDYPLTGAGPVSARGILGGPIYQQERLRWIILGALGSAKTRIRIVTPYFIPDRGLLSGLILAALRGVQVDILLPKRSNFPFVDWASTHQIKTLIQAGCNIYHRADKFDHSKLMTVDNHWALIGSSNWDARSLRLNFEFDLECEDIGFVTALNETMNGRFARSDKAHAAALKDRSLFEKLRDAAARLLLPYL